MKKFIVTIICVLIISSIIVNCDQTPKAGKVNLKTHIDSLSYAVGFLYGMEFSDAPFELDYKMLFKGLINARDMNMDVLSEDEITNLFGRVQRDWLEQIEHEKEEMLLKNQQIGKDFLVDYAKDPSVKVTESGLHYKIIKKGTGKMVKENNNVKVHFTGKFIDGEVFSNSQPPLDPITVNVDEIIAGWGEGLQLMREGDIFEFVFPDYLAYGEEGVDIIEPGMYLIFETEVIEIEK